MSAKATALAATTTPTVTRLSTPYRRRRCSRRAIRTPLPIRCRSAPLLELAAAQWLQSDVRPKRSIGPPGYPFDLKSPQTPRSISKNYALALERNWVSAGAETDDGLA